MWGRWGVWASWGERVRGRLPRMTTIEQLIGAEEVELDLSDLYESPDEPKLEEEVAGAERAAAAFRDRYHEAVANLSPSHLAEAITEREEIESAVDRALT